MSGLAIDRLIVITNAWIRYCHAHLEYEDGGRVLASLQGHLLGYKDLLGFLCAEFGITQIVLEDNDDIPTPVCSVEDMDARDLKALGLDPDDQTLEALKISIGTLISDERWTSLLARIQEKTEELKTFLIDRAEKSRDLDVCQGERRGMLICQRLFDAIRSEADHRERERERKNKEDTPSPFDASQESDGTELLATIGPDTSMEEPAASDEPATAGTPA